MIVFHFIVAKTTESPRNVSNSTTHKPGTLDFTVYLAIDIIYTTSMHTHVYK